MTSELSNDARYVLISVNPKAGRRSPKLRAERLMESLQKRGFQVEIHTDLDVISKRANELFSEGRLRVLVGVGGDGTAAELTNRTVHGVPITLLPSGTANLIAKYLKIPFVPEKLAEMIENGKTVSFDVGKANGRLFLVMVSVGIDADVVRLVHAQREESYRRQAKKGAHISYLSYVRPSLKSISSYSYPRVKTEFLSEASSTEITEDLWKVNASSVKNVVGKWAFVFNLPRYGWGLPLVPKCVGTDQKLDYCIFQGGKLGTALFDVACAQLGSLHRFLPNSKLGQATRFRITPETPTDVPIPYQIDGDPGGILPLEIELVPNRLTFLASEKIVNKLLKKR